MAAPEWYIGDNKGDKVLMVSPSANIRVHNHNSILSAATHEFVHTINFQINPRSSYWIDNGMATYRAHQAPGSNIGMPVPTISELKSGDGVRFGNIGGYQFSYTYIEFLDRRYGWNSVLDLIREQKSYDEISSKSEQEIYNEWVEFLEANY